MTEQQIQSKKIKELESQGYYVIKLMKTNKNGIPDLLVLPKNSDAFFIEVKKEGGVSPIGSPKIVPLQIEDSRVAQLDRFEVEYPNGVRLHLATMPSIEELSGIVHLYREPCFRCVTH